MGGFCPFLQVPARDLNLGAARWASRHWASVEAAQLYGAHPHVDLPEGAQQDQTQGASSARKGQRRRCPSAGLHRRSNVTRGTRRHLRAKPRRNLRTAFPAVSQDRMRWDRTSGGRLVQPSSRATLSRSMEDYIQVACEHLQGMEAPPPRGAT